MASAAQHGIDCIAQRALVPVPADFAIRFHTSDRRLDCTGLLDYRFQAAGDTSPLSGSSYLHPVTSTLR